MQALIDFDGWRKWKDFSQNNQDEKKGKGGAPGGGASGRTGLSRGGSEGGQHEGGEVVAAKSKKKKNRTSVGSNPGASASRITILEEPLEGDEGGKGRVGGVGLGVSDG
jgi:osomolarity two-component system response regulator SSK1